MTARSESKAVPANTNPSDGTAAEFLAYLQGGGELRHLRSLLRSRDTDLLEKATWVASQLGSRLDTQVLSAVVPHLRSGSWLVRYQAVECVLDLWKKLTPSVLGAVIALVEDPDQSVRRKVVTMLGAFPSTKISRAKRHVRSPRLREHLVWLAHAGSRNLDQVLEWVRSVEPLRRRIGVAAALRADKPELLERVAKELHDDQLIPIVQGELRVRKYMANIRAHRRDRERT